MEKPGAPIGESSLPARAVVVGRDTELRFLDELFARVAEHGANVVFVSGEAGIGKSTLVNRFLTDLTDNRWGVHRGQCIEYSERAIPFGPIISLTRSVLKGAGDLAVDILGHHRADLAALLPEWRSDGIDGAPLTGDVDRLIDAISTVLIRAADLQPLALFIEDIHWADAPTRDVIASLVHSLGSARILLIVSERTGAVERSHQLRTWLAEQRRFPNVHTLSLTGLSNQALTEQAEHILGEVPDAALVAELAERTGGNAYFASELLLARRSGDASLPASLSDFLTSRLEQLDNDEQQILRAMAIAGDAISHRVLAAALPSLDVGPPLRRLFDAAMITVEDNNYNFGHALMREAMLRGVLPFEAEDLHRLIAEAMIADQTRGQSLADLATLAMHWSGANDAPRCLAASVEAGLASAKVAAYEPAFELAAEALRMWPAVDNAEELAGMTRDALTIEASDWLFASDQLTAADTLLSDALDGWARDLPDGRRALFFAKLAPLRFLSGKPQDAATFIDQAVALVGDEVSPQAAQVHHRAAKLALANGSINTALSEANRTIDIATEVGFERVLVEALATKGLGVGVTVSLEAGIELVHESRRRALAQNLVSQAAQTYRTEMMIIYYREGRTPQSINVLREGVAFAAQRCGPSLRSDILHDLALGLVEDGSLVEAEPMLDELLKSPSETLRSLATLQSRGLSNLLAGDLDQAETVLASAGTMAERFSSQEGGFQFRLEAELARRRDQLDDALRLIDAALELQLVSDNLTFTRESIIEKCRLVRTMSGIDPARAAEIAVDVERLINDLDFDSEALTGLMQLELGLSRGTATADEAATVAEQLAASGFGADAKRTALLHAQLLAVEQPGSAALFKALDEVRAISASSGMRWLGETADAIAAEHGGAIDLTEVIDVTDGPAPETRPAVPDHGLTPREIEVLGFLAKGLTNKEIGAEMYVSHRTVSTHVSNLLSKLHLKNRSEAASKFHELGFAKAELT